ncbi:hypothetical protein RJ640_002949, partial [Escallonia rubra]
MAEPIAVLICSLFAPMASATFAHSAATRAAAEATTASLLVVFEGTLCFEFSAAAIAAKAAATPATDIAACTSALCNLWSSFRFCLISLSHFFIETCLNVWRDIDEFRQVLSTYCNMSGQRINWEKETQKGDFIRNVGSDKETLSLLLSSSPALKSYLQSSPKQTSSKEVYAIGLGATIRDSRGYFIAALSKRVDNRTCSLTVEALATLDGRKLAQQMGCQKLWIEGDAADIIYALRSTEDNFSKIGHIMDEAKKLVSSFQGIQITQVKHIEILVGSLALNICGNSFKVQEDSLDQVAATYAPPAPGNAQADLLAIISTMQKSIENLQAAIEQRSEPHLDPHLKAMHTTNAQKQPTSNHERHE